MSRSSKNSAIPTLFAARVNQKADFGQYLGSINFKKLFLTAYFAYKFNQFFIPTHAQMIIFPKF